MTNQQAQTLTSGTRLRLNRKYMGLLKSVRTGIYCRTDETLDGLLVVAVDGHKEPSWWPPAVWEIDSQTATPCSVCSDTGEIVDNGEKVEDCKRCPKEKA